jgi:hypothetical protein
VDQTFTVLHDDVVAIAEGGYSAAVAPGSAAYILSVTHGKYQNASVDPAWKWWNDLPPARDPRLPLVDRGMES